MNYESGSSHGARQKLLGKFVYLLVSDHFERGFLLKNGVCGLRHSLIFSGMFGTQACSAVN